MSSLAPAREESFAALVPPGWLHRHADDQAAESSYDVGLDAAAAAAQASATVPGGAATGRFAELLAALGGEYAELMAENARLSSDLRRCRQQIREANENFLVTPSGSAGGPSSAWTMNSKGIGIAASKLAVRKDSALNSDVGHITTDCLAHFDPCDSCELATRELDIGTCIVALDGHGLFSTELMTLQEILVAFREHAATSSKDDAMAASVSNFIGCTIDSDFVNEVFGQRLLRDVSRLRAALVHHTTNVFFEPGIDERYEAPAYRTSRLTKLCRRCWALARERDAWFWADTIGMILTVANAGFIAVSTMHNEDWSGWAYISMSFAAALFVELAIKTCVGGGVFHLYLRHPYRYWNWFDLFILAACSFDIATLQGGHARMTNGFRLVRLVRLVRLGRYVTATMFRELSSMLRGIEAGIKTLIWGSFLLFLICAIQSTCIVVLMRDYESQGPFSQYAQIHFGSVSASMLTLLRCHTLDCTTWDGKSLPDMARLEFPWSAVPIFWANTMLVAFGFFQIMNATYVEDARQARLHHPLEIRARFYRERQLATQRTRDIMSRIMEIIPKPTRSVAQLRITPMMWRSIIKDEILGPCFEDMGYDATDRRKLFAKLDTNADGIVDCSELVSGLMSASRGKLEFDNSTSTFRSILVKVAAIEKTLKQSPAESSANA